MDESECSFENFCRICATQTNQVQNLFETTHDGIFLSEMLRYCLKRTVDRIDGFPGNICSNCKTNLIFTYEFHRICETSEEYFSKRLPLNKYNDEFKENSESIPTNQNAIDADIKIENDYELIHQPNNIEETFDFDARPILASELVCVEENLDVNNLVEEGQENSESVLPISRLRHRSLTKATHLLRKVKHKPLDDRAYECFECKKQFDQLNELRHHMNDHDNNRKPFECTTCNMRFVHLNSWFRHRSRHTKNIHECEYCPQSFNTLTGVKQHIMEIHKEHLKAYKCDQCSEQFALHFLLVWHHEWHKKAKQFLCSTCDAVFFNERKLKAHIRDNHASKYQFRKGSL